MLFTRYNRRSWKRSLLSFYAREILRLSTKRKLSALIAESLEQTRDLESDPEHVVAALELNLETLQF